MRTGSISLSVLSSSNLPQPETSQLPRWLIWNEYIIMVGMTWNNEAGKIQYVPSFSFEGGVHSEVNLKLGHLQSASHFMALMNSVILTSPQGSTLA